MSALAVAQPRERDDRSTQLTALERLETLCDPGSLKVIRSDIISLPMGEKARPGDGVIGGSGLVSGRPVFCYDQDSTFAGGSLGEEHANTIVRVLELADRARAPVVGFVSSGGARMQEGTAALGGYGRVFHRTVKLSGRVPQISVVTGLSAGGEAYSPALTDWIVMTAESSMFLTGPSVVRDVLGEDVAPDQLGGTRVHDRNGVCQFVTHGDLDAACLARELLCYLPSHRDRPAPRVQPRSSSTRREIGSIVPGEARRVYDVREVIEALVDGGELLEVSPSWARSIVTRLARIGGHTIGVIANQPKYLGGVLDAMSAQKGARFVSKCNAFGIPLLVLVDTPGYMPGARQESAGVIRFGASLVHAFAEATEPRVTVILRKAFGGAYITMNSKDLGASSSAIAAAVGRRRSTSYIGRCGRSRAASSRRSPGADGPRRRRLDRLCEPRDLRVVRVRGRDRSHLPPDGRGAGEHDPGDRKHGEPLLHRPLPRVLSPASSRRSTTAASNRRSRAPASTSRTSRSTRRSTTPRRACDSIRAGSAPRRPGITSSACSIWRRAAGGASGRSRGSRP